MEKYNIPIGQPETTVEQRAAAQPYGAAPGQVSPWRGFAAGFESGQFEGMTFSGTRMYIRNEALAQNSGEKELPPEEISKMFPHWDRSPSRSMTLREAYILDGDYSERALINEASNAILAGPTASWLLAKAGNLAGYLGDVGELTTGMAFSKIALSMGTSALAARVGLTEARVAMRTAKAAWKWDLLGNFAGGLASESVAAGFRSQEDLRFNLSDFAANVAMNTVGGMVFEYGMIRPAAHGLRKLFPSLTALKYKSGLDSLQSDTAPEMRGLSIEPTAPIRDRSSVLWANADFAPQAGTSFRSVMQGKSIALTAAPMDGLYKSKLNPGGASASAVGIRIDGGKIVGMDMDIKGAFNGVAPEIKLAKVVDALKAGDKLESAISKLLKSGEAIDGLDTLKKSLDNPEALAAAIKEGNMTGLVDRLIEAGEVDAAYKSMLDKGLTDQVVDALSDHVDGISDGKTLHVFNKDGVDAIGKIVEADSSRTGDLDGSGKDALDSFVDEHYARRSEDKLRMYYDPEASKAAADATKHIDTTVKKRNNVDLAKELEAELKSRGMETDLSKVDVEGLEELVGDLADAKLDLETRAAALEDYIKCVTGA